MQKNINAVIEWIKEQPVKGCITGSSLLGEYWKGMDIDLFCYDEKSFTKMLFAMHHNPMFHILDPLEAWKFEQHISKESSYSKKGLVNTIKFIYNTVIPVNIIYKKQSSDIFSVLSNFDLDIISKAYDVETKQYLDLGNEEGRKNKIATWNKWNTSFYSGEVWQISRILRQLERCFKYYKRGYNVDNVIIKYIELIDQLQEFTDIFNSVDYTAKLKATKANTKIVRQICEVWLKTHEITDEQIELLKIKIKEI